MPSERTNRFQPARGGQRTAPRTSDSRFYLAIVSHYEQCLAKHGDNHLGVDWPNKKEADTRYTVMLDLIRPRPPRSVSLLDFGCGASHFYEYMLHNSIQGIEYAGLDLSSKFVALCRSKFPHLTYYETDILEEDHLIPTFDYIVLNGVFTERRELTFDDMFSYFKSILLKVFSKARSGVAFNVMSTQVDWEREDLFHLPFDTLATFLSREVTRNYVFRADYGLYEYTTYLYK
jgi:SAM-dependent methyltransferase